MLMTMCDHARYNDEDYDSGLYVMDLLPIFVRHYLHGDVDLGLALDFYVKI